MKLEIPTACGNAPRKAFLVEFNVALAEGRFDEVIAAVTEDVVWQDVGRQRLEGKSALESYLNDHSLPKIQVLRLFRVITHGRDATVDGEMETASGDILSFCHVYTFKDTRNNWIRSCHSYQIGG
ncbi:hypothetical protein J2T60_000571 [Natronospira proteinivora]|uniref:SnoaL-like domain-containing protein n=1 Tax=Natronospira proteinivora TaxID=1807133 RepID=A0ABT1G5M0_9GAMM|nr:nuclear transport factor 2 family protein [Natronospira proteinivora]MCP1726606.1 hypothetical protein [Natronospira proteinivora]